MNRLTTDHASPLPQRPDVDKQARSAIKQQLPCVVWFTGLSGAGKSTIAQAVEHELHWMHHHTYLLDGDNVRQGLNRDLSFSREARAENVRRLAEVSRLMVDAGLIVLVACISPFRAERHIARTLFASGEFFEVFVDTPLEVAEARDPKGLYKRARAGLLPDFTGIDSPYEAPEYAELRIQTVAVPPFEAAGAVIEMLASAGIIRRGVSADSASPRGA